MLRPCLWLLDDWDMWCDAMLVGEEEWSGELSRDGVFYLVMSFEQKKVTYFENLV